MEITVLGSGGNCCIPWILSKSRVSKEARIKGGRYVRACPSFFVHGANILIECPETVFSTLDREDIQDVDHLFLTHPHPDHTFGLRFVQSLYDYQRLKPAREIPLYMGKNAFDAFSRGYYPPVNYFWKEMKVIRPVLMEDRQVLNIDGLKITWYCANKGEGDDTFAFLFEQGGKKALFALDDVRKLELCPEFYNLDLLIHECGWFDYKPDGEILFYDPAKRWSDDIKFDETIERISELKPKKAVLMNLEEIYERSYDDYAGLEKEYRRLNLVFAHDGMRTEV